MRPVLIPACIAAILATITTTRAVACPPKVRCLVQVEDAVRREVARTKAVRPVPDVRAIVRTVQHVASRDRLTYDAPKKLAPGEIEMPWIWRVVRERVVSKLPSYEQDRRFTLMVSPVVVTMPSDTVPGLGVSGEF